MVKVPPPAAEGVDTGLLEDTLEGDATEEAVRDGEEVTDLDLEGEGDMDTLREVTPQRLGVGEWEGRGEKDPPWEADRHWVGDTVEEGERFGDRLCDWVTEVVVEGTRVQEGVASALPVLATPKEGEGEREGERELLGVLVRPMEGVTERVEAGEAVVQREVERVKEGEGEVEGDLPEDFEGLGVREVLGELEAELVMVGRRMEGVLATVVVKAGEEVAALEREATRDTLGRGEGVVEGDREGDREALCEGDCEGEAVEDLDCVVVEVEVVERVEVWEEVVVAEAVEVGEVVFDTEEEAVSVVVPRAVRVAEEEADTVRVAVAVFVVEEEGVRVGVALAEVLTPGLPDTVRVAGVEGEGLGEEEAEVVTRPDPVAFAEEVGEEEAGGDFVVEALGVLDREKPADMVAVRVRVVEGEGGEVWVDVRVLVEVGVAPEVRVAAWEGRATALASSRAAPSTRSTRVGAFTPPPTPPTCALRLGRIPGGASPRGGKGKAGSSKAGGGRPGTPLAGSSVSRGAGGGRGVSPEAKAADTHPPPWGTPSSMDFLTWVSIPPHGTSNKDKHQRHKRVRKEERWPILGRIWRFCKALLPFASEFLLW